MAVTTKQRNRWSYITGEKGRNRVRAYEDAKSGLILLEFREGGRRKRVSTGHRNRERAKVQADEAATKIGKWEPLDDEEPKPATLQTLFDIYVEEMTPTKAKTTQVHDRLAAKLFLHCFGPNTPACELNVRHQERFVRQRGRGLLGGVPVGQRTIERDLKWLHAVLNWAVLARDMGGRMLDRNPLKGVPVPREVSPNRPTLSDERYRAMVAVAADVGWRFAGALALAHETGHRIGAILKLRWGDVDLEKRRVIWRKESDKMGFEHETPLADQAVATLKELREYNLGIGEAWVFPSPGDASKPCGRYLAREWWHRAEKLAGLAHINGLGWHGLRRKFATELKHMPLRDLSQLGGWKTTRTVLDCYQKPDEDTMRMALQERGRIRKSGTNGQ